MKDSRPARLDYLAAFLAVACLSVLLTSGNIRSADYVVAYSVAGNLIESGSIEATPVANHQGWAVGTGVDGRPYARYGLGHSLLGIPGQLAGKAVARLTDAPVSFLDIPRVRFYPRGDREAAWTGLFGALTNSLVLGLLAAAVLSLAASCGLSRRQSLAAAALAGIASPIAFQASDFTAEPASALFLVLAATLLKSYEDGRPSGSIQALMWAGMAAGAAVVMKIAHGVLLVPFGLAALAAFKGQGKRFGTTSGWAALAAGAGAGLVAVAAYNWSRFGSPLETGYGAFATAFTNPVWEGAVGQMISPGRGLFVYFPAAILALAGLRGLWRASRPVTILTFGSLLTLWALYSPWFAWEGGWTYGPRLLSPVTPLLCVPAVMWLANAESTMKKTGGWILIAGSVLASLLAFAVDYIDYDYFLWKKLGDGLEHALRWDLSSAPVLAYWAFPERRGFLFTKVLEGEAPWFVSLAMAIALVTLAWAAFHMLRRKADR